MQVNMIYLGYSVRAHERNVGSVASSSRDSLSLPLQTIEQLCLTAGGNIPEYFLGGVWRRQYSSK